MIPILENLDRVRKSIPADVKLVAVSKTMPIETIREAYDAGQRIFGENKAQEMIDKEPQLPEDIEWHFIGHLQRNKVKQIVPFVSLIESVDSLRLLREINKEAAKIDRLIPCLLQFHIAEEESKFGLSLEEAEDLLDSDEYMDFDNIRLCGVMGMATFTTDDEQIRREFRALKVYYEHLKKNYFQDDQAFREISMGMTNDYHIALDEGTTMVRIGSAIFGERNY
ncbi:MAG: YggS family pyridoxal phosphate-dependent enzyme [Bacteroidales bacterium]|nr:YggS family pyridoxal phosphate-dependent enzyme [Bacteroidales bacterium]